MQINTSPVFISLYFDAQVQNFKNSEHLKSNKVESQFAKSQQGTAWDVWDVSTNQAAPDKS